MTYQLSDNPSFRERVGVPSVQAVVKVGDIVSDIREGRNAGVRSLGVLEGSSVMGMTQAAYEALSADEKQAALDRARQMFLEEIGRAHV